jgi:hypothetical protein
MYVIIIQLHIQISTLILILQFCIIQNLLLLPLLLLTTCMYRVDLHSVDDYSDSLDTNFGIQKKSPLKSKCGDR